MLKNCVSTATQIGGTVQSTCNSLKTLDSGLRWNDEKSASVGRAYLLTVIHSSLQPDKHCPPHPPSQVADEAPAFVPKLLLGVPELTNANEGNVLFVILLIKSFR